MQSCLVAVFFYSHKTNSTWLVTSRLDTTRHVRRIEPLNFGCIELVQLLSIILVIYIYLGLFMFTATIFHSGQQSSCFSCYFGKKDFGSHFKTNWNYLRLIFIQYFFIFLYSRDGKRRIFPAENESGFFGRKIPTLDLLYVRRWRRTSFGLRYIINLCSVTFAFFVGFCAIFFWLFCVAFSPNLRRSFILAVC